MKSDFLVLKVEFSNIVVMKLKKAIILVVDEGFLIALRLLLKF